MGKVTLKERDSNIELLRILTMIAVIILHINNSQIGRILFFVSGSPMKLAFVKFIESVCVSAVNIFVLISGYFLSKTNKRNIFKIIELVFQVILVSVVYYLILSLFIYKNFTLENFLLNFVLKNWFVVLYGVLFIISPYINVLIDKLDKHKYFVMLIVLLIIFSIYPTLIEFILLKFGHSFMGISTISMYGSQYGYTIVNFILIYLIAGYIRKFDIQADKLKLILLTVGSAIVITLWSYLDDTTAWSYCNPIVILESVFIFLIFRNLTINNKFINVLSKASFMVYLTHTCFFFMILKLFNDNIFSLLLVEIVLPILIYFIGVVIYYLYSLIFGKLIKKLTKIKKFQFEPLKEEIEN